METTDLPSPPAQRLIVGLGNPGGRYQGTRHNVGFDVAEELARRLEGRPGSNGERLDRCNADLWRFQLSPTQQVLIAMPQTYMNRSGYAVRCLVESYGLEARDILVVYDEIHLPLGRLRLRPQGSPAGHRGLESVLANLGTDKVPRLRLGVAPEDGPPAGDNLPDFVLAPFEEGERELVAEMVGRATSACETWVSDGAEAAMQQWNG